MIFVKRWMLPVMVETILLLAGLMYWLSGFRLSGF